MLAGLTAHEANADGGPALCRCGGFRVTQRQPVLPPPPQGGQVLWALEHRGPDCCGGLGTLESWRRSWEYRQGQIVEADKQLRFALDFPRGSG